MKNVAKQFQWNYNYIIVNYLTTDYSLCKTMKQLFN
jgi:hypothetical protein